MEKAETKNNYLKNKWFFFLPLVIYFIYYPYSNCLNSFPPPSYFFLLLSLVSPPFSFSLSAQWYFSGASENRVCKVILKLIELLKNKWNIRGYCTKFEFWFFFFFNKNNSNARLKFCLFFLKNCTYALNREKKGWFLKKCIPFKTLLYQYSITNFGIKPIMVQWPYKQILRLNPESSKPNIEKSRSVILFLQNLFPSPIILLSLLQSTISAFQKNLWDWKKRRNVRKLIFKL